MNEPSLTVCVLTYKRPAELRRGLPHVLEHVTRFNRDENVGMMAGVLVVDNDPEGSAEGVVRDLDSPLVRYVREPEPGISAGRNRALDETRDSDLLVYIDDDERPQERWLLPLVQTWKESHAAAVMGRVVSEFEHEVDPWITAGRFFVRRRMATGTAIDVAAAGNLLLDLNQIRPLGIRFDSSFGLTGAEDTLFSRMLRNAGGQIVWCDESVASDFVPASRTTRKWVLTRSWSHGNSATLVDLKMAGTRWQQRMGRFRAVAKGLFRVGGGAVRYAWGVVTRSDRHEARGLRAAMRGAGMIAGAGGLAYQEYGRDKQRLPLMDRLFARPRVVSWWKMGRHAEH